MLRQRCAGTGEAATVTQNAGLTGHPYGNRACRQNCNCRVWASSTNLGAYRECSRIAARHRWSAECWPVSTPYAREMGVRTCKPISLPKAICELAAKPVFSRAGAGFLVPGFAANFAPLRARGRACQAKQLTAFFRVTTRRLTARLPGFHGCS